jgi:class 3 adenylate cyclase
VVVCASCGSENGERAKYCRSAGAPLTASGEAPVELRKLVTVVFCDVTESTTLGERLDPETLRR